MLETITFLITLGIKKQSEDETDKKTRETIMAKLAEGGHTGAKQLATYFVGQGVGLMNDIQDTRTVMREFMEDYLEATERLASIMSD